MTHPSSNPPVVIKCVRLPHAGQLPFPGPATPVSAGLDLRAAVTEDLVLESGRRGLVPTGLVIELPPGTEGQIRPRSGLAHKHGLTVLNSPGTVDADYRGEVKVLLINLGDAPVAITRGMRIAQLVVARHCPIIFQECDRLEPSSRGEGGFGHTGLD